MAYRLAVGYAMMDMTQARLHAVARSDIGRARAVNEDSLCVDERLGLLLVADGLGGHIAGEVASQKALATIRNYLAECEKRDPPPGEISWEVDDEDRTWDDKPNPATDLLNAAIQRSNQSIYSLNRQQGFQDGQGMGTTLVGLWHYGARNEALCFNIGDSRLYRYRQGRMRQLSKDHTMYQQCLDHGHTGIPPHNHILLRALGLARRVNCDMERYTLKRGDLFLLCSDGLTSMVSDEIILAFITTATGGAALEPVCERLVNLANENGGTDNITLILARYE